MVAVSGRPGDYLSIMTRRSPARREAASRPRPSRALGRGYRAHIRQLDKLGLSLAEILAEIPGLNASELELTLSRNPRRGRPPKRPSIESVEAVRRWRATQRPRTLRAALECIDFLLTQLER